MTRSGWYVLLIGVIAMTGNAEAGPPAGFIYESIRVGDRDYRYVVYRPRELDAGTPARGLVFLHGRGECGTDGSRHLAVGLGPRLLWEPERWPFVVIFPQKPDGESEWEDHGEAVMAMLDRVIADHNVDPGRVAITGLSQGGHGAIALVTRHPDRFRAAAVVCGYVGRWWGQGARIERRFPGGDDAARIVSAFRSTPVRLFHGGRDDVVPPAESEWLHALLDTAGVESTLTIYPEANHNTWDEAYGRSGVWKWLVKKTE